MDDAVFLFGHRDRLKLPVRWKGRQSK